MDNQKRLRRNVNSKLRTALLLMLVAMFVISSVMTVNAATIKDDGKYTLLLTCGLNGPDGKIRLTAELNLLIGQRIGRAKQGSQKIYPCRISNPRVLFG